MPQDPCLCRKHERFLLSPCSMGSGWLCNQLRGVIYTTGVRVCYISGRLLLSFFFFWSARWLVNIYRNTMGTHVCTHAHAGAGSRGLSACLRGYTRLLCPLHLHAPVYPSEALAPRFSSPVGSTGSCRGGGEGAEAPRPIPHPTSQDTCALGAEQPGRFPASGTQPGPCPQAPASAQGWGQQRRQAGGQAVEEEEAGAELGHPAVPRGPRPANAPPGPPGSLSCGSCGPQELVAGQVLTTARTSLPLVSDHHGGVGDRGTNRDRVAVWGGGPASR